MKKIFRMQYEPCLGTCYEYDDILMRELSKLSHVKRDQLLGDLNYIHNLSCGDTSLGFILDYDENLFIGNFIYSTGSQSFVGKNINDVYSKFRKLIDWYYKEVTNKNNVDKQVCDHGREDNIIAWTKDKIKEYEDRIL